MFRSISLISLDHNGPKGYARVGVDHVPFCERARKTPLVGREDVDVKLVASRCEEWSSK